MLKSLLVIFLIGALLAFPVYAHALPGDAELVLENISIEPPYPKKEELVTITGNVYNAGLKNTKSFTSFITIAYFVDGKLLHINAIDNVEPGISNKIKISSSPIWKAEMGNHKIKIIVDYHNTLKDQYDSPSNNALEKTFFITPSKQTQILLDASPQYFIQGKEIPKILVSLIDFDSNEPLSNKKIIFNLDDTDFNLTTNKEGKISFLNTIIISGPIRIGAYFDGDVQYSSSNSSLTLYSFPKETTSSFILTISDLKNQYNFEDYFFEIVIFQDSYKNLIKKIQPDSATLLDPKTFWISLPPKHNYFAEIYLDGRLFFVTDKDLLKEDNFMIKELRIPETATIRFKIITDENQPIMGALVKNWIYYTSEDGFTDWIDILPTTYGKPYVAEILLPDNRIIKSNPFLLFSGEKKTIHIIINDIQSESNIPAWIKNNAGWWAEGTIDDSSFVQGMQFLIKEDILKIPSTTKGTSFDSNGIPAWIKNNAGWWAEGTIDDSSFVQGMQFLIKEGIMRIY